jgi:hypothetical protein
MGRIAAEHVCALDWEKRAETGTDSARFLAAGAKRSFWLRTKQGYLAEGLPLLRKALREVGGGEWLEAGKPRTTTVAQKGTHSGSGKMAVIIESNSLMQFLKPSLYFAVIDPVKDDFKESAQMALDRAHALVLRGEVGVDAPPARLWMKLPVQLMKEKPSVLQREGEDLPEPLRELVHRILERPPDIAV